MKKYYKAYNKDMTCRGFQFKEGEAYEEDSAELCCKGFHFCENPLDTLNYYPLIDDDGNLSCFSEVEPLDKVIKGNNKDDTKCCTKKIKIGAQLSLGGLIKASFDYIKETAGELNKNIIFNNDGHASVATSGDYSQVATSGDYSQVATSGDYSQVATSGDYSKVATSGYSSQVATSGDYSQVATSGDYSKVATSGYSSQVATSGDSSKVATSGDYSKVATSGDSSQVATSGDYSQVATSGDYSKVATSGDYSIAANIGRNGRAKATKGSYIVLAEYKWDGKGYMPINVKSRKVDGKKIKANVWYKLQDGKFVEAGD